MWQKEAVSSYEHVQMLPVCPSEGLSIPSLYLSFLFELEPISVAQRTCFWFVFILYDFSSCVCFLVKGGT